MPSAVELSLSSLVPTLSPVPDELSNLATSLLAQSRTKASTLKPEEEIGRTYACCHIACQRLGHKLALEIATPTPPVKPKVYNKLHTFLNSVLKTSTTPRSAGRTRAEVEQSAASTPQQRSGTSNARQTARSRITGRSDSATSTPATTPTSRKRKATAIDDEPAGLIDENSNDLQKESTTHEDEADEVEQHIYSDEDAIIRTPRSTRPAKTPLRRKEKHGTADDDDLGPAGLLPGLGTMFQPAVDWLSDDRRLEYDRWKKTILRQAAAAK